MRNSSEVPPSPSFLIGGGIMGDLIRSKNWTATLLGPIESWPQSLRTTVSLCLASNFPINLIWGPDHIQIYNDGYRPICAGKHPQCLGEDYTRTWASAWETIGEAFQGALSGETSFLENQRMFLDRNGYLEETFFTFSLSPIRDESGEIGGLFHPVTETTPQMLSQRRTRSLQDLVSLAGQSKTIEEACVLSAQALGSNQLDLPFVLIYLTDGRGHQVRLIANAHLPPGTIASPEVIALNERLIPAWPLTEVIGTAVPSFVDGLAEFFGVLDCGPYPESPNRALVSPIFIPGLEFPAAFLIAGVSPRLPFTDQYHAFLDLVTSAITAAIINARSYETVRERARTLAELDRAKTAFFSNVSHEFRTPLTLMMGPLEEMLSQSVEPLAIERASVSMVHRNGLRLLRLVNALLDFSRVEANRADAQFEPVDLALLTQDLASTFRSATEKAGLTLEVNCESLSEEIYVDRESWEKIILNLLSNAFKFTLFGSITVTLRELEDRIELCVSDTGVGIAGNELPNLFKRFHRVQGAQGRSQEGSGIGLALVDELVRVNGGTVRAESEFGRGTTFRVTIPKGSQHLPVEQVCSPRNSGSRDLAGNAFVEEALHWLPKSALERSPANKGRPANSEPLRRILLADDNADMRQYIGRILSAEFEIEAVCDGKEALEAIEVRLPDLVLTDVMMPNLDGFGLLKELRGKQRTRGIPIIMLSARAGEEARIEGIQGGADDYLVKPFNARELLARVRVNLELAQLRQDLSREEEKRRSAEEIQHQWQLFDTALSHTPDLIYIFDRAGRFTYANRQLLAHHDKSFADIIGEKPIASEEPPHFAAGFQDQVQLVGRLGVPLRDEASVVDSAGITRHYDYTLVPVFSTDGEVEAIAGCTRDITALIEANRSLRSSNAELEQAQEKFRLVVESSPTAMVMISQEGNITLVNTETEKLFGYHREELLGQPAEVLMPERLRANNPAYPKSFFAAPSITELGGVRKDGSEFPVQVGLNPIQTEEGPMVLGAIVEITESKKTEETIRKFNYFLEQRVSQRTAELAFANKELEAFAYVASHDLKAPLRAIDNVSQWLEDDLAEHFSAETRENMNSLRGRIGRMDKLLDDLLEYARIGRTTDERYSEIVAGDALMDNVVALLSPVGFTVKVSARFAAIHVSRMPLQQILMNLVSNAIKHHHKKEGGSIDVTVEDSGVCYTFTVRDDGPGIPTRFHNEIFKMFRTLRPRDQVEGSGMGLAMVRKHLEVFGGALELESTEGNGSTFRFTWPKQQQMKEVNHEPDEGQSLLGMASAVENRCPVTTPALSSHCPND